MRVKTFGLAIVVACALSSNAANATNIERIDDGIQLVEQGRSDKGTAFELTLAKSNANTDYLVEIKDVEGNNIYKNIAKAGTSNKFLLNNTDGSENVKFVITNLKTKESVTYKVNQVVKTVSETVIEKI